MPLPDRAQPRYGRLSFLAAASPKKSSSNQEPHRQPSSGCCRSSNGTAENTFSERWEIVMHDQSVELQNWFRSLPREGHHLFAVLDAARESLIATQLQRSQADFV